MTDLTTASTSIGSVQSGSGSRVLALLAGAGVALAGGLVWAGVVITTHFDIGILAVGIGAATGLAVKRLLGEGVGTADRIAAGVFAAAGIAVGKYVIFVHAMRTALGSLLAAQGLSVGYLDSRQVSIFVHNIGSIVRPIYALWIGLAFVAALRTTRDGGWRGHRPASLPASVAPAAVEDPS